MSSRRVQDMSSNRFQDVFSVTFFVLQDVFKTFGKMSSKHLQGVLEEKKLLRWICVEDQQMIVGVTQRIQYHWFFLFRKTSVIAGYSVLPKETEWHKRATKFTVGDRISFNKGFTENQLREIFTINSVFKY